jgi:hypothetical protein
MTYPQESSSEEDSDEEEAPVVVKKTNKAAPEVVAATAPVYDSASTTMGLHKIYVKVCIFVYLISFIFR